jgi:hypothetical protein
MYDLTGGVYLLGKTLDYMNHGPTFGYSYVSLSSLSDVHDRKPAWRGLHLETRILDVVLAIREHDLIAALTVCVFPALVNLGFDFREAKRTWTIHWIGM